MHAVCPETPAVQCPYGHSVHLSCAF
jgi:hypothetical protein